MAGGKSRLRWSEWDWERRSAFFWLAIAVATGEMNWNRAISLRKRDGSEIMTSTQHQIAAQAQRLIPQVEELYERALALEKNYSEALQNVDAAYRDSVRNLLHYLAVRQIDIRQLQIGLASIGLSSLGRMEANTLSTLSEVLFALHRIADRPFTTSTGKSSTRRESHARSKKPSTRSSRANASGSTTARSAGRRSITTERSLLFRSPTPI
jgi:hypothetical protein